MDDERQADVPRRFEHFHKPAPSRRSDVARRRAEKQLEGRCARFGKACQFVEVALVDDPVQSVVDVSPSGYQGRLFFQDGDDNTGRSVLGMSNTVVTPPCRGRLCAGGEIFLFQVAPGSRK